MKKTRARTLLWVVLALAVLVAITLLLAAPSKLGTVEIEVPYEGEPHLSEPATIESINTANDFETGLVSGGERLRASELDRVEDITLLHVRVADSSGAPVVSGEIECTWPLPTGWQRLSAAITGECTTLRIAPNVGSATLVASALGRNPATCTMRSLRRINGGAPSVGVVEHDVRMLLPGALDGPVITGRIIIDGHVGPTPDDVEGELRYDSRARDASGAALYNQPVIIDRVNERYVVYPKSTQMRGLSFWSQRTVHEWVGLAPEEQLEARTCRDVVLHRGEALKVVLLSSTETVASRRVTIKLLSARDSDGKKQHYVNVKRQATTDENGMCIFEGLPAKTRVGVFLDESSEGEEGAAERAEVFTESGGRLALLTIDLGVPRRVQVRGQVICEQPSLAQEPLRVGYRRVANGPPEGSPRPYADSVSIDKDREWFFAADSNSTYQFWLERGKRPICRPHTVAIGLEPIGNILLAEQPDFDIAVEWSGAKRGHRLLLSTTALNGLYIESGIVQLESERGSHVFKSPYGEEICIAVSGGVGSAQRFSFDWNQCLDGIKLDLARNVECRMRWSPSVPALSAPGRLQLACLDQSVSSPYLTSVDVRAGGVTGALSMLAGKYFFRFDKAGQSGLACGIVNIEAGDELVEIVWSGKLTKAEALLSEASGCVCLASIEGVDLSRVDVRLRQLRAAPRQEKTSDAYVQLQDEIYVTDRTCIYEQCR